MSKSSTTLTSLYDQYWQIYHKTDNGNNE